MFGSEALRLLRERWKDPTELAEEIYAILSSVDLPIDTSAPINSTKKGSQPAATLKGFSNGDTVLTVKRPGLPNVNITLDDLLNLPGLAPTNGGQGNNLQAVGQLVQTGLVISGGPGDTYQVRLDPQDPNKVPNSVRQLQIDPNETIPAGTSVLVFLVGARLVMQVPVWL